MADFQHITSFIWTVADDVLRDDFKRSKYPDVILPFTVLARIDCVLAPTKENVVNYLRLKSGACYRVGYHALYRLAIPPLPRASGEQTAIGSLTRALAAMFFAAFRSAFSA